MRLLSSAGRTSCEELLKGRQGLEGRFYRICCNRYSRIVTLLNRW
jgi:hypothetical protein